MKNAFVTLNWIKNYLVFVFFGSFFCLAQLNAQQQSYKIPQMKSLSDFNKIIYIDPFNLNNGTGSIDSPYNYFPDVEQNTAYLIKSGTQIDAFGGYLENVFIGRYGEGAFPVIYGRFNFRDESNNVTFNELSFMQSGEQLSTTAIDFGKNSYNITFNRCKIIGDNKGGEVDYPHYLMKGSVAGGIFYGCEIAYCRNDGIYAGGFENAMFVSNYFHHQNLSNGTGDAIQLESSRSSNIYFANNYIDRGHTRGKFGLIINSRLEWTSGAVAEYNTFIAPKNGQGGAGVRWFAGDKNKFNKNLMISREGIINIATSDEHAKQPDPYGVRDNHLIGTEKHRGLYDSNIHFADVEEYEKYLVDNGIKKYGSNIEINDFWGKWKDIDNENDIEVNSKPTASISGPETMLEGREGILDGSASSDPDDDNLTFFWEVSSSDVTFINNTSSKISFIAPAVEEQTQIIFKLTVTDIMSNKDISEHVVLILPDHEIKGEKLVITDVDAIEHDGNLPEYTIDAKRETRWSAEGTDGKWISYEFSGLDTVYCINISWYKGDERVSYFDVEYSKDKSNWVTILSDYQSSGMTDNFQTYMIDHPVEAKYLRVVGYGNSNNDWNSINEVEIYGKSQNSQTILYPSQPTLKDIVVYPNPVNSGGHLYFKLDDSFNNQIINVELISSSGRLLQNHQIKKEENYLKIPEVAPGIYFLRIKLPSYALHKKVLIQ